MDKFNGMRVERFNTYWENLEKEGIETPRAYIENINDAQECISELDDANYEKFFNNSDYRHILTRFYPYNEQSISLALEEPRLTTDDSVFPHEKEALTEVCRHSVNPTSMAEISTNYYIDYLAGDKSPRNTTDNFRAYILSAFESVDCPIGPDENESHLDYFQIPNQNEQEYDDRLNRNVDPSTGVWSDFYITNYYMIDNFKNYKKPSGNNRNLREYRKQFAEEIKRTNSSIAIISSAKAWKAIKRVNGRDNDIINGMTIVEDHSLKLSDDIGEHDGVEEVHGCLYKDSSNMFYIPTMHLGGPAGNQWGKDEYEGRIQKSIEQAVTQIW